MSQVIAFNEHFSQWTLRVTCHNPWTVGWNSTVSSLDLVSCYFSSPGWFYSKQLIYFDTFSEPLHGSTYLPLREAPIPMCHSGWCHELHIGILNRGCKSYLFLISHSLALNFHRWRIVYSSLRPSIPLCLIILHRTRQKWWQNNMCGVCSIDPCQGSGRRSWPSFTTLFDMCCQWWSLSKHIENRVLGLQGSPFCSTNGCGLLSLCA